jgi:hypothetical protein
MRAPNNPNNLVPLAILAPIVAKIINSAVHTDLQCSPTQLVLRTNCDPSLYPSPNTPLVPPTDRGEFYEQLDAIQLDLLHRSRQHQANNTDLYLLENSTIINHVFSPGDYVLVKYPEKAPHKFAAPVTGPMLIVSRDNNDYVLRDLLTDNTNVYHSSRLRIYNHADYHDLTHKQVAMKNSGYYEVDEILDHRGDHTKRSTLQFLVSFHGYDHSCNQWVSTNEVCRLPQMHTYTTRFPHLRRIVYKFKKNL